MHPSDTVLLMAAILAMPYEASNDDALAEAVCMTHRLIEMNNRHEQWAGAAYDSRYKSKWLPDGESRDIQF